MSTPFSLSTSNERVSASTWFTPSTAEHDAYRKLTSNWGYASENCFSFWGYL